MGMQEMEKIYSSAAQIVTSSPTIFLQTFSQSAQDANFSSEETKQALLLAGIEPEEGTFHHITKKLKHFINWEKERISFPVSALLCTYLLNLTLIILQGLVAIFHNFRIAVDSKEVITN
jgi:hypothetical protein